jgi:hypothetical protein
MVVRTIPAVLKLHQKQDWAQFYVEEAMHKLSCGLLPVSSESMSAFCHPTATK